MSYTVALWSSTKKTGKTVFAYVLTNYLMNYLSKDVKVLVACVNLNYGNLMGLLKTGRDELNFEDIVNFKAHPSNKFEPLHALARKENFYFLGSKKTSCTYASRHIKVYEGLLEEFKNTFDLILIDTISGSENTLTNMIISKSDYVLNILNQDKELLDRCPFVTGKELAFIINRYRGIYPDAREISSTYGLSNVFTLPQCDQLQEMKNKGNLEFYLQHQTEYNASVKAIAEYMTKILKLDVKKEYDHSKGNSNLFAKIIKQAIGGAT